MSPLIFSLIFLKLNFVVKKIIGPYGPFVKEFVPSPEPYLNKTSKFAGCGPAATSRAGIL
jgi:hypothetical protein